MNKSVRGINATTGIAVHSTDDSLEHVSQRGWLRCHTTPQQSFPKPDVGTDPSLHGNLSQRFSTDQYRPQTSQLTLIGRGEFFIQSVRNHKIENGVSEKFESFVLIRRETSMRERFAQ